MARFKLDPAVKFQRELAIWYAAQSRALTTEPNKPLLVMPLPTLNKAIGMAHRLNGARAQTRPIGPDGYPEMHPAWDQYTVKPLDNPPRIEITFKQQFDWSGITDGNGNPITAEEVDNFRRARQYERKGITPPTDAEMTSRVERIQREMQRPKPPHDPTDPSFLDTLGAPEPDDA